MLYERYAKRRFQEGKQVGVLEGLEKGVLEGRVEGREERDKEWMAWFKRREEALAAGKEFDEPSPSGKVCSNGQ